MNIHVLILGLISINQAFLDHAFSQKTDSGGHGKAQLTAMLSDRPRMAVSPTKSGYYKVREDDAIYKWVETQFGRQTLNRRILWNPSPPVAARGSYANSFIPSRNNNASICIGESRSTNTGEEVVSFEEMWAGCVFELLNVQQSREYYAIRLDVVCGIIDKEEWLTRCLRLEHNAVLATRKLYFEIWQPWSQSKRLIGNGSGWFKQCPEDFDEWRAIPEIVPLVEYWNQAYRRIAPIRNDLSSIVRALNADRGDERQVRMELRAAAERQLVKKFGLKEHNGTGETKTPMDLRSNVGPVP